jgi:hypothetical protein
MTMWAHVAYRVSVSRIGVSRIACVSRIAYRARIAYQGVSRIMVYRRIVVLSSERQRSERNMNAEQPTVSLQFHTPTVLAFRGGMKLQPNGWYRLGWLLLAGCYWLAGWLAAIGWLLAGCYWLAACLHYSDVLR